MMKITTKSLCETLFRNKVNAFCVDFRTGYDPENEIDGDCWHAEIIHVGPNTLVLVVQYSGNKSFSFDISKDSDPEPLYFNLKNHIFDIHLPEQIWVDTESTISADAMRIEDSPAETADKYLQAMELLQFISDEFDGGRCSHTEIEERLDAFFKEVW